MLADERDRLGQLAAGDLQVLAAFAVSYGQLGEGDARQFRLLGLHPGTDFDAGAAAALAGIEAAEAGAVLGRLAEACLVTEDGSGRFGLHDLLRLFARGTCQEVDNQSARDAAEGRLIGHYADLARFLDSCLDPRQRQAAEQAGKPLPSMREALEEFETERPSLLAALGLAVDRGWDEQVVQLGKSMGNSLTFRRYLGDLLVVRKAALAAARHSGDTCAEGKALDNLGRAYRRLRRFEEAVSCYQESLATYREAGDRHGKGTTLKDLGNAYRELRRFEEAVRCYQESLATYRETGDRHGEGIALSNLGNAYLDLGQPARAAAYWRDAAAAMRDAGDHEEAARLEQQAASTRSRRRRWRRDS
jgi:tetratricopeptide (TPR) repeat protein